MHKQVIRRVQNIPSTLTKCPSTCGRESTGVHFARPYYHHVLGLPWRSNFGTLIFCLIVFLHNKRAKSNAKNIGDCQLQRNVHLSAHSVMIKEPTDGWARVIIWTLSSRNLFLSFYGCHKWEDKHLLDVKIPAIVTNFPLQRPNEASGSGESNVHVSFLRHKALLRFR